MRQLALLLAALIAASSTSSGAVSGAVRFDHAWDREGSSRYHDEIETARVSRRCFSVAVRGHDESGKTETRRGRDCV
ncbi:hypothetical protein SLNSH_14950 [Alsobacter soli]|uniref:Secreted protein n=1 Tax=Alsobacter soli TaxID=2109933 RepID=A0A2T1HRL3_9HYPH|nr:hypothetical protein [Alsobacter soli]PSC04285.1 hypothetical protein SLNSH_14950 [Alsobacter soli]